MKGSFWLKALLAVAAAFFILHQCISSFYNPVKTESAIYYTAYDGLKITGVVVRNETLVTSNGGVMHFVTDDGSRVAKNGVIANIYDSESASITLSRMDAVNKKIEDINDLLSYNNLEAADLNLINQKIEQSLNNLIVNSASGNYNSYLNYSEALLSAMNRKQAALGSTENFSAQLDTLKAELKVLSSSLPQAKGQITSKQSGYFVSKVDGYEGVLSSEKLQNITPEYLADVKPQEVDSQAIGKIVSDYEWYIVAKVTINESLNYKEGEELILHTSVKTYPKLPVTVNKINISESSSSAIIIFSCNEMNSELASMRSAPMTVVKKEYSGLKVPKKALRVVDGKRGVYVLTGMQVKFVPVNMLYSNSAFMICEKQSADENVLRLYDEVIVKGKKLYDGKIIS